MDLNLLYSQFPTIFPTFLNFPTILPTLSQHFSISSHHFSTMFSQYVSIFPLVFPSFLHFPTSFPSISPCSHKFSHRFSIFSQHFPSIFPTKGLKTPPFPPRLQDCSSEEHQVCGPEAQTRDWRLGIWKRSMDAEDAVGGWEILGSTWWFIPLSKWVITPVNDNNLMIYPIGSVCMPYMDIYGLPFTMNKNPSFKLAYIPYIRILWVLGSSLFFPVILKILTQHIALANENGWWKMMIYLFPVILR